MCGIAGFTGFSDERYSPENDLRVMSELIKHRGPDGEGYWYDESSRTGFAHRRLSIIDIEKGQQPMVGQSGCVITYNGEIYNYKELRKELSGRYLFTTESDTEVILAAYSVWGEDCVNHFRGMFAFAIWDPSEHKLFCARDRFGIKPFYYTENNGFFFASEMKALLPILDELKISSDALNEYFVFQINSGEKTLFEGVKSLSPAHTLTVKDGRIRIKKYWELYYNIDFGAKDSDVIDEVSSLIDDTVSYHMRSDTPIGAYVSGGADSGILAGMINSKQEEPLECFTGKFSDYNGFDESGYARDIASEGSMKLHELDINVSDFESHISSVIYHLDTPVAGVGSFAQYMVSGLASKHGKVLIGGQGGDEIFGGYARYLLAYFEQCIKGAIEGTLDSGNFVVTYESIIPNLRVLEQYKPMIKEFWKDGLFEPLDKRYFNLVNRAPDISREVNLEMLGEYDPYEAFSQIFNAANVEKGSYFDKMTHYDFKTLLPGLLHVEDRVSMAHGLESRVPFLDHELIEKLATISADIKFKGGKLKRLLLNCHGDKLPDSVRYRKDKMGFPVPLNIWIKDGLKDFIDGVFATQKAKQRDLFYTDNIIERVRSGEVHGRKFWGLLSLELWMQEFYDNASEFRKKREEIII